MTTPAPQQGYLTKEPTKLQSQFVQYITDQTGYNPAKAHSKLEAFREGVRLATALRAGFRPMGRAAREQSTKLRTARPVKAAKVTAPIKPKGKKGR